MPAKRNAKGQFTANPSGAKTTPAANRRAPVEFTPTANPAYAEGMRQLRSSGAAGAHLDGRQRRARTRSAALSRALREQN
jgi:hypothetical protein